MLEDLHSFKFDYFGLGQNSCNALSNVPLPNHISLVSQFISLLIKEACVVPRLEPVVIRLALTLCYNTVFLKDRS